MHPYKTITQTLLVFCIVNPVLAAPIPRGADTLPSERSVPLQDPAPSNGSPPLSATDGRVPEITEEAPTSPHPLSSDAHVSDSTVDGPTSKPHAAVVHDTLDTQHKQLEFSEKLTGKRIGTGLLGLAATATVLTGLVELWKHSSEFLRREHIKLEHISEVVE